MQAGVRDLGVLVGVGTHKPEVIELVEEQGWDVDFYAGCVYNRTRTEEDGSQLSTASCWKCPAKSICKAIPRACTR